RSVAARFAEGSLDQPTGEHVGEQKQSSLIFFNECPKVVDRFRYLISEDDFHNVNKRSKVETNDILFSMIGTIGLTYLEQSEIVDYAIKNIGLFKTSQNPDWRYYTFLWINSYLGKEFIHEYRSGSTQEYIALGSLRSIVFDVPPLNLLLEFNKIIHTYFQKIKNNMLQIYTLEKLRNTLLPKLMSGEVKVEMEMCNV
ncbi:MAG: restriction endonuclease subunit S, partial [Candidatus Marinimicrobia bacterium]|nr:restriction endonuclease subunit S [Candidatus Neomarinimicrobiota bacterium]